MLVYLSFYICTVMGTSCHVTVPLERGLEGLSACYQQGEMMGPSWEEAHDGWKIERIRCTIGKRPVDDEAT